jgi:hypothetical protein
MKIDKIYIKSKIDGAIADHNQRCQYHIDNIFSGDFDLSKSQNTLMQYFFLTLEAIRVYCDVYFDFNVRCYDRQFDIQKLIADSKIYADLLITIANDIKSGV